MLVEVESSMADEDAETAVGATGRRTRHGGASSFLVGAGLCALLAVVPACSSSTSPAAAPTTTTSTTSAVNLPVQSPAELATCVADAQSVQTALDEYMTEKGVYPSPPAPWSAASYAADYAPLTAASGGGPFLHTPPGIRFYVIEYDSAGHVWIAPPGIYGPYNKGQDFAAVPDICDAAVG
jgi:hypothetical protein